MNEWEISKNLGIKVIKMAAVVLKPRPWCPWFRNPEWNYFVWGKSTDFRELPMEITRRRKKVFMRFSKVDGHFLSLRKVENIHLKRELSDAPTFLFTPFASRVSDSVSLIPVIFCSFVRRCITGMVQRVSKKMDKLVTCHVTWKIRAKMCFCPLNQTCLSQSLLAV